MSESTMKADQIPHWIKHFNDPERKSRIWEIGLLTGWRKYPDGSFGAPNFERALIMDRIIETTPVQDILEIGTGRGLGCVTMAQAGEYYGKDVSIITIDCTGPESKQDWPIRLNGVDHSRFASRNEIWDEHFNHKTTDKITQITGYSTDLLPRLVREGRKYDLIFIDGGHDPYSVISDLSNAMMLIRPSGIILMDDFAPLQEYGIGTCFAILHARRFFENVDVFPSEGMVFGGEDYEHFPRGMILLYGLKSNDGRQVRKWRLLWWKIANYFFNRLFDNRSFPLS